ncbi:MAG: 16S rRNA (uracil(1498)-N(3))-methyltransferase [Gammaproteobacteria bacterium RIFCSPHIGHO2_12_FULL_43_28]|nr:MAG: 16S rRNA (uracil(1498)-N(3))-methyltransferase [Gammaproteobacteria bacterium RIFCSPHIGHO2_12_FULL_43_28]
MPITRIFQAVPMSEQATIELDEKASHHVMRVMRAKVGDPLTLFNGEGGEYHAIITELNKKSITVQLLQFEAREIESPIHIHLGQGIAKGEKMDFVVQKAVELGVFAITALITERSNVRLDQEREIKKVSHWESIVVSACEQSGRNCLPKIAAPKTLAAWLTALKADRAYVLSPHVHETLAHEKLPQGSTIALLIGPEGGLSPAEMEVAFANGFKPLNLGPRVLRTETATIAAMTAMQCRYGDM